VPAPLPFAIPVGSIVWSPHQMLRRGTASTDRSCEASWGTARTRPSFGGARQAPEGPLREGTGAANIAFPEAPATLRDSTWKRSAGSQCAPPRTGGVSPCRQAYMHASPLHSVGRPRSRHAQGQLSVEVRSAAAGCHKVVTCNSTQATCPCCERRTSPACAYSLGYGDTPVRASGHGPGGSRGNAERSIRRLARLARAAHLWHPITPRRPSRACSLLCVVHDRSRRRDGRCVRRADQSWLARWRQDVHVLAGDGGGDRHCDLRVATSQCAHAAGSGVICAVVAKVKPRGRHSPCGQPQFAQPPLNALICASSGLRPLRPVSY
jgi:hypothetical protein